jgi:hypothetical protein
MDAPLQNPAAKQAWLIFDIKAIPSFSYRFIDLHLPRTTCTKATRIDQQSSLKVSVLVWDVLLCRHGRIELRAFPVVLTRYADLSKVLKVASIPGPLLEDAKTAPSASWQLSKSPRAGVLA